ncbi:hypothetical protein H920_15528 [Fukomys damarensis]|uniref:Uncharacterized protein n=1 Tax=Fukomys damarensis TaxID=885580 RepID=A0A091CWL7_FUKDA|nr:hypothetical protein H920_15528 [Fukomys damarensis]
MQSEMMSSAGTTEEGGQLSELILLIVQETLHRMSIKLIQALCGRFNSHVHDELDWRLLQEDLDEGDDDVDEKLQVCEGPCTSRRAVWVRAHESLRSITVEPEHGLPVVADVVIGKQDLLV